MGNNNILKRGGKNLDLENWFVYHPNGKHMFTCGSKKAHWYLDRDLAKQIGPFKIKFTFEPNGLGYDDDEDFGRAVREPICVVTGREDNLQRHHIVPYCYRSHFSSKYKSKNHHDVVLLNADVHSEYEKEADKFKDEIAHVYGIKTISEYNAAYVRALRDISKDNSVLISKIAILFKRYGQLPREAILENLKYVSKRIDLSMDFMCNLNYIQLLKLYNILKSEIEENTYEFKGRHRKFYDHGWHLVQKLNSDEKIFDFVKLWRKHFIETMNPQYMPEGWSIDFRYKTKL